MIITTSSTIPGYAITESKGLVKAVPYVQGMWEKILLLLSGLS